MRRFLHGLLFWAPRVLGLLIFLLLTLLSTDVFAAGSPLWQALVGFLIHMLPGFAVLIVLVLGWRREWIGALGFLAFAVWYLAMAWEARFDWTVYAILAGIPGLIGILFLAGWRYRDQIRPR